MKKYLKVLIVVLLVLAVIGGTCYFFFRKIEKENNTTASIVAMLESESKANFDEELKKTSSQIGLDNRLAIIVQTSQKLDEIVYSLSTYYVEDETKINDEAISSKLNQVNSARSLLTSMINEYNIKKSSTYFDKNIGANDLYIQACSYLVKYATFANLLNSHVSNVEKDADFKFNAFEIYSNIVINTFSDINSDQAETLRVVIKDQDTINIINELLKIRNSYVVKIINENTVLEKVDILASENCNKFNEFYNKCDKTLFAKELCNNLDNVKNAEQDTNEKIATYYFKLIYGI